MVISQASGVPMAMAVEGCACREVVKRWAGRGIARGIVRWWGGVVRLRSMRGCVWKSVG